MSNFVALRDALRSGASKHAAARALPQTDDDDAQRRCAHGKTSEQALVEVELQRCSLPGKMQEAGGWAKDG